MKLQHLQKIQITKYLLTINQHINIAEIIQIQPQQEMLLEEFGIYLGLNKYQTPPTAFPVAAESELSPLY